MNYNTFFHPAETVRRFTSSHSQNFSAYCLIIAVVALTIARNAITAAQWLLSYLPELRLRAQLYRIYGHRWFVRRAIALVSFFEYNSVGRHVALIWSQRRSIAIRFFDSLFCLEIAQ